jgi:hypothetical protein
VRRKVSTSLPTGSSGRWLVFHGSDGPTSLSRTATAGSRRALTAWDRPEGAWSGYTLSAVDVNGDWNADLVWNQLGAINRTYIAISNGDGTFHRAPKTTRP